MHSPNSQILLTNPQILSKAGAPKVAGYSAWGFAGYSASDWWLGFAGYSASDWGLGFAGYSASDWGLGFAGYSASDWW
jgi:hypothetical protein